LVGQEQHIVELVPLLIEQQVMQQLVKQVMQQLVKQVNEQLVFQLDNIQLYLKIYQLAYILKLNLIFYLSLYHKKLKGCILFNIQWPNIL
jgi:hypothetical protein